MNSRDRKAGIVGSECTKNCVRGRPEPAGQPELEAPACKRPEASVDAEPSHNSINNIPHADHVPKFLGDKVLALTDPDEGQRKQVTILVADIADYSSLSKNLSPEEAYEIITRFLEVLEEQIRCHGGIMAQVSEGTVKGLFGAPASVEDHAKRACEAALAIRESVGSLAKKVRKENCVDLGIRIGLVSDVILTGSVSGGVELDSRDLDDADDLIPVVQGLMKPGKIAAARSTFDLVSDFFDFQPIKQHERDGIELVVAYELLKSRELASPIRAKELKGLSKFVGREQEMSVLLEAAEKARRGRGQTVAVTGDAGVGKSRLVLELQKRVPEGQQIFLEGYCRNYNAVGPYGRVLDMLRSIFDVRAGEKENSAGKKIKDWLALHVAGHDEIVAPMYEILALKVEDERYSRLPYQQKRSKIFQAVERVLVQTSRQKPLIAIVEDLHWIDRTSEELLRHLIGRISDARIFLVMLYRPEYAGASQLGAAVSQVHLAELPDDPARELAESILGGEADDSLMNVIRNQTAGNPLFIEELTKAFLDSGEIEIADYRFTLMPHAQAQLLPKTIQGVISARIDRLEKDVKTTLQVASVIGREVPLHLLERITESGEDISSHISRLQKLEFIHGDKDRQFAFKHALTQEAAYTSLLTRRRLKIHHETAKAIEKLYSDRLEEFYEQLAHHFGKSGNLRKEFKYLKLSALKASRQKLALGGLSIR